MVIDIAASNILKTNISFNLESAYISTVSGSFHNYSLGLLSRYTPYKNSNFVAMIHTISGSATITTKDCTFECSDNDLVFVRYIDRPNMDVKKGFWHFHCFWFFYENLDLPLNQKIDFKPLPHEAETMKKIIELAQIRTFNSTGQANGLAQSLICEILSKVQLNITDTYSQALSEIMGYINTNIQYKLSIPDLAKRMHVSEKHFRFLFERFTGMTPKQYITKIKLEKSVFLLTQTNLSIAEISNSLDFCSPTHYINTFTRYYHVTPLLYRKNNISDFSGNDI